MAMRAEGMLGQLVPTARDRHGRLRVPAMINERGPFSLILDTGANHCAISGEVASSLGAQADHFAQMIVHGVTGSARVPTIKVDSIALGGFKTAPMRLPIIADAMDGADGFLSANSLAVRCLVIQLKRNVIAFSQARWGPADSGYVTLRTSLSTDRMLSIDARINGVLIKTVLDTGAGSTIGNLALQSVVRASPAHRSSEDDIVGTSTVRQTGTTYCLPPIELGPLRVRGARISCSDLPIFRKFGLASVPAMIAGMDVLGQLDSLVIDYLSNELHLRPSPSGFY